MRLQKTIRLSWPRISLLNYSNNFEMFNDLNKKNVGSETASMELIHTASLLKYEENVIFD